jgi:hypothetical protein
VNQSERASGAADRSLANGSVAAQPSAAAGSLTGNRGIPQTQASSAQSTDTPSASASAETPRNAPAAVQPSNNRDTVGTSGFPNNDQQRPVGTSGSSAQATPPAAQPAASQPAPAKELPKTASPLPMSALVGFLSLVAALSTRALRA